METSCREKTMDRITSQIPRIRVKPLQQFSLDRMRMEPPSSPLSCSSSSSSLMSRPPSPSLSPPPLPLSLPPPLPQHQPPQHEPTRTYTEPSTPVNTHSDTTTSPMIKEDHRCEIQTQDLPQKQLIKTHVKSLEQEQREQRQRRLTFLVERAGLYSNWLAEKLEARQREIHATATTVTGDVTRVDGDAVDSMQKDDEQRLRGVKRQPMQQIVDLDPDLPAASVVHRRKVSRMDGDALRTVARSDPQHANGNGSMHKKDAVEYYAGRRKVGGVVSGCSAPPRTAGAGTVNAGHTTKSGLAGATQTSTPFKRKSRQPALVTGGTLREYQLVGMEWLISLYDNGLNGILADEMGLGKTLQTIAFLAHLREMGTLGPFLIVAPLSTLANWVSEIERFTPSIPVVCYHGNQSERAHIRNHRLRFMSANPPIVVTSYEICMNDRKYLHCIMWRYLVVDEGHRVKNLNCRLVRELKAYDSTDKLLLTGTPLQNNLSELWSLLNFLMPDIFDDRKSFEEWFEFANDLSAFSGPGENHAGGSDTPSTSVAPIQGFLDQETRATLVNSLHQILKPFLLRRVKSEVAADLPKKREYLLYAPLVPRQRKLYDAALRGTLADVLTDMIRQRRGFEMDIENLQDGDSSIEPQGAADGQIARNSRRTERTDYRELSDDEEYFSKLEHEADTSAAEYDTKRLSAEKHATEIKNQVKKLLGAQKLQNVIVQLRKVCNHPFLFNVGPMLMGQDEYGDRVETKTHESTANSIAGGVRGTPADVDPSAVPEIVSWSGKMLVLERLLPALFARRHKVLIFSQMTRMLDIIGEWCTVYKNWRYCRIDGNVSVESRRSQMDLFNTDPTVSLFLLSTRAGGLGINLTAADTVVIVDSDWNPQVDLQAQDRVHRIGQHRPVVVYRLVTSGTVERQIFDRAQAKRRLERLVIHRGHFKGSRGYYQSDKPIQVSELIEALAADDTELANSGACDGVDGDALLPCNVLTDQELERILDRRAEAYTATDGDDTSEATPTRENPDSSCLSTDAPSSSVNAAAAANNQRSRMRFRIVFDSMHNATNAISGTHL